MTTTNFLLSLIWGTLFIVLVCVFVSVRVLQYILELLKYEFKRR